MSLLINLTPDEEAMLSSAAMQTGLDPEAFAARLVREHLPVAAPLESELDIKLSHWHRQDNTNLMPTRTTAELFAEWDKEDAKMMDEEREAEDQLWEVFQKGINETRAALGMRQL